MPNFKRIVFELWKILDDIDTAGDIAKSDDKAFRDMVEELHRKRHALLEPRYVDALYRMYYK